MPEFRISLKRLLNGMMDISLVEKVKSWKQPYPSITNIMNTVIPT